MTAPRVGSATLVVVAGAMIALAVAAVGCATRSEVRTRTREITSVIEPRHGEATVCAPKDLAWAEALSEVARYESARGDAILARVHLDEATAHARRVYSLVQAGGERCSVDRDFDGIPDHLDECPDDPEDFDGMEDTDGCPEDDSDGDGISDRHDRCVHQPEDNDGFEDEDGCPDLDNDRDGIPDIDDQCPNQPEDRDGFEDEDGCPDPDNDQDGIADVQDKCPNEPEDFDGDADEDGCPDLYQNIIVRDDQIVLKKKVYFEFNKAIILPPSYDMLNEVADVISKHPTWVVRIEGHTDDRGSARYNKRLSQKRANAVRKYLIAHGVSPQQLMAVGMGEEHPIADNRTEEGRSLNRRVEFHIVSK